MARRAIPLPGTAAAAIRHRRRCVKKSYFDVDDDVAVLYPRLPRGLA